MTGFFFVSEFEAKVRGLKRRRMRPLKNFSTLGNKERNADKGQ